MSSPLKYDHALGDLPSPTLLSPMLRAVEPTLNLTTDDDDEEEVETLQLPPAAARTTQDNENKQVDGKDEDDDDDDDEEEEEDSSVPHYDSHLYHSLESVLAQAESGRSESRALIEFVRGKAELDRLYASKLRSLSDTYSSSLRLPSRPRATTTFEAGCCALRNMCANLATNSRTLADKLEEEVSDVFLDEAQELSARLKALTARTRASMKARSHALEQLDQSQRALSKTCAELSEAKAASSAASEGPVDFLSELVSPFRVRNLDSLAKKVSQLDAAYIASIKAARAMRAEYDRDARTHLAQFESIEVDRMSHTLSAQVRFVHMHQACFGSHLKNISAVHTTLATHIRPAQDIQTFIAETVDASRRSMQPSPLPVYKLFRGHPRFGAAHRHQDETKTKKKKMTTNPNRRPLTDSDDDDDHDDDGADDSAAETPRSGVDASDLESDTEAASHIAASMRGSKPVALTASQQVAISTFLSRVLSLPTFSTATPAVPISLEPEKSIVLDALHQPAGRTALAHELKRVVGTAATTAAVTDDTNTTNTTATSVASTEDVTTTSAIMPSSESSLSLSDSSPSRPHLLASSAAIVELHALLTALIDAAAPSMHVQPIASVVRSARCISCSEPDLLASSFSSVADDADSAAAPATLFSHICLHPLFSSSRYYEVSFLADLDRGWRRHASVHRWQSDAEQATNASQQRFMAFLLLQAAAQDMMDMGRMSDQQVVSFVSKMSLVNQLDESSQSELVSNLACFDRLALTEMPPIAADRPPLIVETTTNEDDDDDAEDAAAEDEVEVDEAEDGSRSPTPPYSPDSSSASIADQLDSLVALPVAQPVDHRAKRVGPK